MIRPSLVIILVFFLDMVCTLDIFGLNGHLFGVYGIGWCLQISAPDLSSPFLVEQDMLNPGIFMFAHSISSTQVGTSWSSCPS